LLSLDSIVKWKTAPCGTESFGASSGEAGCVGPIMKEAGSARLRHWQEEHGLTEAARMQKKNTKKR
jgi:hypothetical protein